MSYLDYFPFKKGQMVFLASHQLAPSMGYVDCVSVYHKRHTYMLTANRYDVFVISEIRSNYFHVVYVGRFDKKCQRIKTKKIPVKNIDCLGLSFRFSHPSTFTGICSRFPVKLIKYKDGHTDYVRGRHFDPFYIEEEKEANAGLKALIKKTNYINFYNNIKRDGYSTTQI